MLLLTHVLFALFVGILISKETLFIAILMLASIIPDLDVYLPLVKHRGFFHSILIGAFLSLLFIPYSIYLSLAFLIGFCTHLFTDSLTVTGTKPFWPLNYRLKFGLIKTGHFSESIFVLIIFILMAYKLFSLIL